MLLGEFTMGIKRGSLHLAQYLAFPEGIFNSINRGQGKSTQIFKNNYYPPPKGINHGF